MPPRKLSPKPYLSIIVPAFRSEKIISTCLIRLAKILDGLHEPYEIICVIDGYHDRGLEIARSLKIPQLKIVGYTENQGKGHAVRFGMSQAIGDIIGFVDMGLDINYGQIPLALEHMKWYSADVVIGSKRHPVSKVTYPWQRRILSFGYQILAKTLFGLKVRDTQVGMKLFRKPVVKKVLPKLLVKRFAFDIEILAVANYLGFTRIYETPVEINLDFGGASGITSEKFLRQVFHMLWDTLAVFYRLRILRYYDD